MVAGTIIWIAIASACARADPYGRKNTTTPVIRTLPTETVPSGYEKSPDHGGLRPTRWGIVLGIVAVVALAT